MNALQQDKSSILLLCLGTESEKASLKEVTAHSLYQIFRPFGALNKIILFSRNPFVKAFVEFSSTNSSEIARRTIHESNINDLGRARIYFSPREELSFSNKYLDCLDCTRDRNPKFHEDFSTTHCSASKQLVPKITLSEMPHSSGTSAPMTPTRRPERFNFNTAHLPRASTNLSIQNSDKLSAYDFASERKVDLSHSELSSRTDRSRSRNPADPSRVVLVSNIDEVFANSLEVFNLFSCFGNIAKVLFMKNLRKALLEFTTVEFAENCMTYMNNRPIGKSKVKVNFSKYQKIDLKKNNKSENSQQFNDVTIVSPEMERYSVEGVHPIVPPSDTLLVSCEKKEDISTVDIYLQLQQFGEPVKTSVVNEDSEQDKENEEASATASVCKVQIQFGSIHEAMLVLSKSHNSSLKGARLSVSFSPSKII